MKSPQQPVEKFEAIYRELEGEIDQKENIQRHLEERVRYLRMLNQALSGLPRGSRALELGCGTGIDSCILSQRHPHVRFFGLDIARGSLVIARRVSGQMEEKLHLVRGDVFQLPFPPASFSIVFHQGLVEHFADPGGMMREQERILAPGGWAVISVPQVFAGYTIMKRQRIRAGTWPWGWERSFSAGALRAAGRRSGLVPIETRGEGYWCSWGEPAWVLRDLYGKVRRRSAVAGRAPFAALGRLWEGGWTRMEEAFGHRFLKNVIVSFQKPARASDAAGSASPPP